MLETIYNTTTAVWVSSRQAKAHNDIIKNDIIKKWNSAPLVLFPGLLFVAFLFAQRAWEQSLLNPLNDIPNILLIKLMELC